MNRAEEVSLAWALTTAASAFVPEPARLWLCAKIGAGEPENAIMDTLAFYARTNSELPVELAVPVRAWIRGYAGSDREPILRRLVAEIRVAAAIPQTAYAPEVNHRRLVMKRSERVNTIRTICRRLTP